jgi:hypothetical protein
MTASVRTIYRNGRRLAKASAPVVGDLNLDVGKNPVSRALCSEACLLTERGSALVPPLYDAVCVVIAGHGLRLRGIEIVAGREIVQEWWCVL